MRLFRDNRVDGNSRVNNIKWGSNFHRLMKLSKDPVRPQSMPTINQYTGVHLHVR